MRAIKEISRCFFPRHFSTALTHPTFFTLFHCRSFFGSFQIYIRIKSFPFSSQQMLTSNHHTHSPFSKVRNQHFQALGLASFYSTKKEGEAIVICCTSFLCIFQFCMSQLDFTSLLKTTYSLSRFTCTTS